ncbi:MAG: hypothetical protein ABFS14_04990 [Gemmatimonadota bacterium]
MTTGRPRARKKAAAKKSQMSGGRVKLIAAEVTRDQGAGFEVRVELEWQEQSFVGEDSGVGHEDMIARLAAMATISALKTSGSGPAFELVGLKRVRAFDGEVVMVCLRDPDQSCEKYIGAVAVRETLACGVARAVLDAVNRVLVYEAPAQSGTVSDSEASSQPAQKNELQAAS